jgi:phosphoglycolate phosphatase-like HAD superfamily hydrolase
MVKYLLETHKLDNNETLMIGDSLDDHLAGIDNDLDFVYCTYGYGDCSVKSKPKYTINCPIDVYSVIESRK